MNVNSVKDRLKNYSKKTGKPYQEILTYYALERTIYRLSKSNYVNNFIIKGGIYLYAIHDKNYVRATTDIDMMAHRISNDAEKMKDIFIEILSADTDDAIKYDLNTLDVHNITEFKEYHGLNVSVAALLDRTRIPVAIDIGYNDIIVPDKVRMTYPTILDMNAPEIYAYSLESVIAEKLEAIVSNGLANSRYKDFYDIYVLSREHSFIESELAIAIKETFGHRKTELPEKITAFTEEFYGDPIHESRWASFLKRKKVEKPLSLKEIIIEDSKFINPLIPRILTEAFSKEVRWDIENENWI